MSKWSRWWRPRFRLASLLWLMLCIAVAIGMYRIGHQSGHEDALNRRTFVGTANPRVYFVSDIIPATPAEGGGIVLDFDSLMDDIKEEVLPYTWEDRGGAATMSEFPSNFSLVISHDEDGHERIGKWLRKRREEAANRASNTARTAKTTNPRDR